MVEYRGATIQDLDALLPLVEAFVRERAGLMNQKLRENFMETATEAMVQTMEHPATFVCVAEAGSQVVGYASGLIQEPPPLFEDESFLFLADLYVQPELRRQGVGTALVERVRGWGLMRGIARCSMVVPLQSEGAAKVAGRVGARLVEGLYYWQSAI